MKTMIRNVLLAAVTAAAFLGFGTSAGAAQPVVQACVGSTFSDAAHALPPGELGALIAGFSRGAGLGGGIQQMQAGELPDDVAVNACN
jgi:hypothetical protein